MTEWNTTLPTMLVVGWTQSGKITDAQIHDLLVQLETNTGMEVGDRRHMFNTVVRTWIASL